MTLRYARLVTYIAAAITVLGAWLAASPFVLTTPENATENALFGLVVAGLGAFYLVQLTRDPEAKLSSLWLLVVVAGIVLTGAMLVQPHGTLFFWSTAVVAVLVIALVAVVAVWGSRFGPDGETETTIYGGS
ncbi:SPW repeat protein [Salarchaeum sp. JOR-1]|uniref:SPW repeat protein n=1 Tax=Salarchaeum sp. JOR-1 TaxID=2599399 RepID=UPI001198921C|nr:SPW repeat protein [Salarchaeum sp. JOR-1]QDX39774.1 hypothetical protein FQU85_02255 [Salarchaeum sp. JOR-1]